MTIYNPHLLARQELVATFVARQPLLDELVDDLRRGGGQHHLLVGGRGSGKTTLLLRLATAIEDDKQLAKKCIPLRFPEEQYNVSRLSDFWMNAIDALADALERQGDGAAAKRLEPSLTELEPLDETERSKRSLALLESWAKQSKRLIVLLVDNLDLVLDRLSESLWELREALSIDNRLVMVGASSKFIEEAIHYQSPFYDFFRVHELGPLSEEEARGVVLSLARRDNTPKVAEVLERDPGRFKALYVLTGGTPRTLALLHTVLALESSDRIERDLDGLLDQLTPYYKARFDDLPSQSQVIVDKVALHWHPITAAECQAATHLDVNVVSAQLSRLVKSGLLTKVSLPGPGKLGFQLSERFFNIWYLMRASRRLRRRLSWFVEFLRIFYDEEDLRRHAEELIRTASPDSFSSPAQFLALASAITDEALRRRLEFRAVSLLAEQGVLAVRELMDLEGEDMHLVPVLDRVQAMREIRAQIGRAKVRWPPGHTSNSVAEMIARHPILSVAVKQWISRSLGIRDAARDAEDVEALEAVQKGLSIGLGDRLLSAISTGEVPALCDVTTPGEMRQVLELGESRPQTIMQLIIATEALGVPLSDEVIRQLLSLDPQVATEAIIIATSGSMGKLVWARIRHLVLLVMRHAPRPIPFGPFVVFFSTCISKNLTAEGLALLVDAGMAERWAPLYEAFRAAAEGSKARLDGLAPEVRTTARILYDWFCATGVSRPREGGRDNSSGPARQVRKPAKMRTVPTPRSEQTLERNEQPGQHRSRPKRARPRKSAH